MGKQPDDQTAAVVAGGAVAGAGEVEAVAEADELVARL